MTTWMSLKALQEQNGNVIVIHNPKKNMLNTKQAQEKKSLKQVKRNLRLYACTGSS